MSAWAIIPLVSILCYGGLLTINFRQSDHGGVNGSFNLYLLAMILWSLGSFLAHLEYPGANTLLWNRVLTAGSAATPFTFFLFVQFFLHKEQKKLLIFTLILFTIIEVANFLGLVIKSAYVLDGQLINQYGPAVILPSISWPLYIGLSAGQLILAYRNSRDTIYRNRIKYLLSVIIVIFLGTMTNITKLSVFPIDIGFNVISAGLIAYAVLRYQLLDLSVVIRKSLLYSIPTIIIGALYFLVIHFIWRIFTTLATEQMLFLSLLVAILSALVAQPIRDKAQLWVDRFFFRERSDINLMLQRVSRTASTVLEINSLTNMILKEIYTNLHVSRAAFFLKSFNQEYFELSAQEGPEIDPVMHLGKDHPVVRWLTANDQVLSRINIEVLPVFLSLWRQEREALANLGVELWIPVKAKGMLVGIMAIGPKRSEETFSQQDHITLMTLASQTAIAIENARLFAEAKQRAAEMIKLNGVIQEELSERLRAEAALKESEERFRRLAENAPDLIYRYRTAPDCEYEFMSTAANEMFGYSPVEFYENQNLQYQIIHPDDISMFQDMMQGKLTREPITIRFIGKGGNTVWMEQHVVPIYNNVGQLVAIEGIARDITQRKQDEAELAARIEQLEKHNQEMIILNEMGDALQACQNRQEAYPILQKYLKQLFITEMGILYVLDSTENQLEMAAAWGKDDLSKESFAKEDCYALHRGKPHLIVEQDEETRCMHITHENTGSHLCIPMLAQSEALGLLVLLLPKAPTGPETKFSPSTQQLAMTVAEHIGLALANLRLSETLRQQAIHDPLTELFNRRYMEEMLERELARAIRRRSALGIIFIDIDHFKQFNDQYGHAAGDQILRDFSKYLKTRIRKEDIACRYGGEEFILILPDVNTETTCQRAEAIRQGVEGMYVSVQNQQNLRLVTLSMGVSIFPENGQTVEELLRSADVALYQAKQAGRNRYILANSSSG